MQKTGKAICQLCTFHRNKPSRCERKREYVARKNTCDMHIYDMTKFKNYYKAKKS